MAGTDEADFFADAFGSGPGLSSLHCTFNSPKAAATSTPQDIPADFASMSDLVSDPTPRFSEKRSSTRIASSGSYKFQNPSTSRVSLERAVDRVAHLLRIGFLAVAACTSAASCKTEPPPSSHYAFLVHVVSDPGKALAGATVTSGGKVLGTSGADGLVRLEAGGTEGTRLSLQVTCPEGHKAPAEPLSIVLRTVSEREKRPEYPVACTPMNRSVVVAVRADGGPNLPVLYLGHEVARTDESGAAHVKLDVAPGETLEIVLDTSAVPGLRPSSPSARFRIGNQDEVFVMNQTFEAPKHKVAKKKPPPPEGPIEILPRK
jgi:hypothetical protein